MIKTENYIRELYFILFRQWRVIIGTTILFFVIAFLIAFLWPPTYSASGSVLIKGRKTEKSPEAIESVELRPSGLRKEDLQSEIEIIISPDVIERTIKYLQGKNLYRKDVPIINEVYSVQKNLRTKIIPISNIIGITYLSRSRTDAVNILNALMEQYINSRLQVYSPSEAEKFYSQQADIFRDELYKKEKDMVGIIESSMVADPQKEIDNNLLLKHSLEQQLYSYKNEATERRLTIQHLENTLKEKDSQMFSLKYLDNVLKEKDIKLFSFIDTLPFVNLNNKLQELYIERGKVLRAYNENSDKVKLIDKQIRESVSLLKSEVNAYKENQVKLLRIAEDKIRNIEDKLEKINTRNVELKKMFVDIQRVEREAKLNESSYSTFSKRREEAKVDRAGTATTLSTISVVSRAFPSESPVFPRKEIVIPFGLLAGLITGCSFGFLREFFDHTFKKPSDVYNYAGLPVIFSIPDKGYRITSGKLLDIFKASGKLSGIVLIFFMATTLLLLSLQMKLIPSNSNYPWNDYILTETKKDSPLPTPPGDSEIVKENVSPQIQEGKSNKIISDKIISEEKPLIEKPQDKTEDRMDQESIISAIREAILFYDKEQRLYFLQVHSFKYYDIARKESDKLKQAGLQSFVMTINVNKYEKTYRVLIGPFSNMGDALKAKSELEVLIIAKNNSLNSDSMNINPFHYKTGN